MQMNAEKKAKETPLSTAPKTSAAVRKRLIGIPDLVAVDGKGGCNEAWAVIEDRSLRRRERRSDVSSRGRWYGNPLFERAQWLSNADPPRRREQRSVVRSANRDVRFERDGKRQQPHAMAIDKAQCWIFSMAQTDRIGNNQPQVATRCRQRDRTTPRRQKGSALGVREDQRSLRLFTGGRRQVLVLIEIDERDCRHCV